MDDQNNPYRASDARIIDVAIVDGDLADRGERLVAALLDGLLYLAVAFPIMYYRRCGHDLLAGTRVVKAR